jgi:ribosomal protein S8
MSWYIYNMLFQIRKAQMEGGEYVYRNDGSMDRNLRFLIEHGYVQEVYPWPSDGEGLTRRVTITQSGQDLIAMRGN